MGGRSDVENPLVLIAEIFEILRSRGVPESTGDDENSQVQIITKSAIGNHRETVPGKSEMRDTITESTDQKALRC